MFMRLDFSSKFTSPTLALGQVATLAVEGTEKSRRVFSAMGSVVVAGAWKAGSLVDNLKGHLFIIGGSIESSLKVRLQNY